jgi:hypothetical protein
MVVDEISGPTKGLVPVVGGAPGVGCCWGSEACAELLRVAAPIKLADRTVKNFLRDFSIAPPRGIIATRSHNQSVDSYRVMGMWRRVVAYSSPILA